MLITNGNETNMEQIEVTEAIRLFSLNKPIAIISVRDQFYQVASKSNFSTECHKVSEVPKPGWVVKGGMIISKDSPFQNFFNFM
jgi:ATP sulfurylase